VLVRLLKHNGTVCVGTLKINRKGVPKTIKNAKLKKAEIVAQHSGPATVMKWRDKWNMVMIFTFHSTEFKTKTK
jgi:hypothetical protein